MLSPWLCLPKRHNVLACVFDKKMFLVQQLHLPHTQPTNLNRIQVWSSAEYKRFYKKTTLLSDQYVQVQIKSCQRNRNLRKKKLKIPKLYLSIMQHLLAPKNYQNPTHRTGFPKLGIRHVSLA